MLRVRWCGIVLMAHVPSGGKTVNKRAVGTGIWSLFECHTKTLLKNVMQNWKEKTV